MTLQRYINPIIIFLNPPCLGSRGIFEKINRKLYEWPLLPNKVIVQQNAVMSLHERGNSLEYCSCPNVGPIFFPRSERKSEADSLIGPRISTAIGNWFIIIIVVICCFFIIVMFLLLLLCFIQPIMQFLLGEIGRGTVKAREGASANT